MAADDSDSSGSAKKKAVTSPTTPSKNLKPPRNTNKKRSIQETVSPPPKEECTPSKKNKMKAVVNGPSDSNFECPELNCDRKYKNKSRLQIHMRTVHENTLKIEFDEYSGKVRLISFYPRWRPFFLTPSQICFFYHKC